MGPAADRISRHLEGDTCDGVIGALRLVLALGRANGDDRSKTTAPSADPAEDSGRPPAASADRRSRVELAIVSELELRTIAFTEVVGATIAAEVSAPTLGAQWFRPSARLGFGAWDRSTLLDDAAGPEMSMVGATMDLCPFGVAPLSTAHVDLVLAVCGVGHVGRMAFLRWGLVFGPDDLYAYPADALWVDGGGVARVEVQIGRKGRYRGVISASAGLLRQLNAADPEPPPQLMSSSGTFASFGYPVPGTMWSMAVGGGLLFP